MRKQLAKLALTATLGLATTLTLSCGNHTFEELLGLDSSSSQQEDNHSSSSFKLSSSLRQSSSSSSVQTQTGIIYGTPVTYQDETYQTVVIGEQTWFQRNLNYTVVKGLNRCYNDNPANCKKYGRLYNWATAMALPDSCTMSLCASQVSENHKGICPSGWHLPSNNDWNVLMKTVNPNCPDDKVCAGAGTKLKSINGWNSYSGIPSGTDDFGFSALPGGDSSNDFGKRSSWWSSSELNADGAYGGRSMSYDSENVNYSLTSAKFKLSNVRCLKD
jgi:uncharacterized protein (TIGR02145 family)